MTTLAKHILDELSQLAEEIILSDDKIYTKDEEVVKIQMMEGSYVVEEVTIQCDDETPSIDFSKLI
ncbi:MAG: hypothetical protein ACRBHB_06140 [Arenicella sp.]